MNRGKFQIQIDANCSGIEINLSCLVNCRRCGFVTPSLTSVGCRSTLTFLSKALLSKVLHMTYLWHPMAKSEVLYCCMLVQHLGAKIQGHYNLCHFYLHEKCLVSGSNGSHPIIWLKVSGKYSPYLEPGRCQAYNFVIKLSASFQLWSALCSSPSQCSSAKEKKLP